MSDDAKDIEEIDETLWIRVDACDSHDYLVGNSHTFPGRMSAYCPTDGIHYSVSLSEIEEMSPEARRWVAGFLAGNEPRPEDMFGPAIHDAYDSDPRWRRWRDAIAEFRNSGSWPHADWGHLIPFPPGTSLPPLVWTIRGDEVWTWADDEWIRADPQPDRTSGFLSGTVCAERGHCELTMVSTVHAICEGCGETSQVIPEGLTREEWERAQYDYRPAPT